MAAPPTARTDEAIQRDVLGELQGDARVQPSEIGVAVKGGVVILTGSVDSLIKKVAAEEAAHRMRGVKAVVNDIEVRLPLSHQRTDTDIAAAVVHTLQHVTDIPLDQIKVTVSDGWVTLTGEVSWHFQKEDIERTVWHVMGVRGITNAITVRPLFAPSPSEIKQRIEDGLVRNAALDAQRISVEMQGDRVILRGTVQSWAERQEAERIAWSIPGVTSVDNQITIGA
jgi:osmotically-inducible protein OsmY